MLRSGQIEDAAVAAAVAELNAPLLRVIRADITAGIRVHSGELARHDAAPLVLRTRRQGCTP